MVDAVVLEPDHGLALDVRGLRKTYPGVVALDGVDLHVERGAVVGLAGANGAGKSTLVNILSGAQAPDGGEIWVDGRPVNFVSPHEARAAGVYTIFQELSLVPQLSVAENIYLDELQGGRVVRQRDLERRSVEILDSLGGGVDPRDRVGDLSLAQQQLVEIAKALKGQPSVLLLDEPTTTLPPREVDKLLELMRSLATSGVGLIFISHRLDEVTAICDSVEVLRDGRKVTRFESVPAPREIVRAMIGERYENSLAAAAADTGAGRIGGQVRGDVVLSVQGLADGQRFGPCSFELRKGEALGVTGLLGSGQNELAEALFGSRPVSAGKIQRHGRETPVRSPRAAVAAGIGYIPEDRKTEGLVLGMSVRDNTTLASLGTFSHGGFLRRARERHAAEKLVDELHVKCTDVGQRVVTMSGGNQQKVLFARWLVRSSEVLVMVEPTRGVDVGAKEEIYRLVRAYLEGGGAVLLVTSEVAEASLCDRVLVMSMGRVVAEATHEELQNSRDLLGHLR
ncbi:sugar ABC transporter ATP-binding protein [Luteimicrobium album]|uniref:sugar ABC transporter ATP-binding protein n=1 Tax=Luteimicrobium album TaxID=1054550 RepID=UPI0024E1912A|nr:sugar ABC transporter ATP-binding protein [Luteimicrobium album]